MHGHGSNLGLGTRKSRGARGETDYYPACPDVHRIATPIGELVVTASDAAITASTSDVAARRHRRTRRAGRKRPRGRRPTCSRARGNSSRNTSPAPAPRSSCRSKPRLALRAPRVECAAPNPYGTTTSYGALAKQLGDRFATRAVASPTQEPFPSSCRVIESWDQRRADGIGGGLDTKRWLLETRAR